MLGPMRVVVDGEPVAAPASRRAWSLLAYLALHPGRHRRADLAARFWPDVLDASARQSLRSAIFALRRALGPVAGQLVTSRDEIALEGEVWADCREFARLVDAGRVDEALALGEGRAAGGVRRRVGAPGPRSAPRATGRAARGARGGGGP